MLAIGFACVFFGHVVSAEEDPPYQMPLKFKWVHGAMGQSCNDACTSLQGDWKCDEVNGDFGWPVGQENFEYIAHMVGLSCNATISGRSCYDPSEAHGMCGWERETSGCPSVCSVHPPPMTRRVCPCSERERPPTASHHMLFSHFAGVHSENHRTPQMFCGDEGHQVFCTADQEANGRTFRQRPDCDGICFPENCINDFDNCVNNFLNEFHDRLPPVCRDPGESWCLVPLTHRPISEATARHHLEALIKVYDNVPRMAQIINDNRDRLLMNILDGLDPEEDPVFPKMSVGEARSIMDSHRRLAEDEASTELEIASNTSGMSAPDRRLVVDCDMCCRSLGAFIFDTVNVIAMLVAGARGLDALIDKKRWCGTFSRAVQTRSKLHPDVKDAFRKASERFHDQASGSGYDLWQQGKYAQSMWKSFRSLVGEDFSFLSDIQDANSEAIEGLSFWRYLSFGVNLAVTLAMGITSGGTYLVLKMVGVVVNIIGDIRPDIIDLQNCQGVP